MKESLKPIIGRMVEVWTTEHRPVTYHDFIQFVFEGKQFCVSHTNFRNKIHELVVEGKVRRLGNSFIGQYLLTHLFDEYLFVTENHTVVSSVTDIDGISINNNQLDMNTNYDYSQLDGISNFCKYIHDLPVNKLAIHDINTMNQVPSIYEIVSRNPEYNRKLNCKNKGIMLEPSIVNGTKIQKAIYPTDTVTAIVGCSSIPIPFNKIGKIRFYNTLSKTRDEFSRILKESADRLGAYESNPIPDVMKWTLTLCHFGWDKPMEYADKGSKTTSYDASNNLFRSYPKKLNGSWFRRVERQESPRISVREIMERMDI